MRSCDRHTSWHTEAMLLRIKLCTGRWIAGQHYMLGAVLTEMCLVQTLSG